LRSLAHGKNLGAPQPLGSGARHARLLPNYASPTLTAARSGHESGSEGLSEYLETKLVAVGGLI
jgi:hypothetical protein